MWKIVVIVAISFAPITMAKQQQATAKERQRETQQPAPAVTITTNESCTHYEQKREDKPQGWHKLVAWPEGIVTWAIILTLGAIIWQSSETRRAAIAANRAIEIQISKERARLKIGVEDISPMSRQNNAPFSNIALCWLHNHGATVAFIDDFRARYIRTTNKQIAVEYDKCKQLLYGGEPLNANERTKFVFGLPLEPSPFLSDDEVIEIRKAESSFLHFYGYVRYRDAFERKRRRTVHVVWIMRWGGKMEGQIMQWWEQWEQFSRADNDDIEEPRSKRRWDFWRTPYGPNGQQQVNAEKAN